MAALDALFGRPDSGGEMVVSSARLPGPGRYNYLLAWLLAWLLLASWPVGLALGLAVGLAVG